jgi:hypothetical protein
LFPEVQVGFGYLKEAAQILSNPGQNKGKQVRRQLRGLLARMRRAAREAHQAKRKKLAGALEHFGKVTASYEAGLFHCYDHEEVPRTNNDLEQLFGSHRYHERRASGRKGGSPTVVVRGPVRLVAALVTRKREPMAEELVPRDPQKWQQLRQELQRRRGERNKHRRFRQNPDAYLRDLESKFTQSRLPT